MGVVQRRSPPARTAQRWSARTRWAGCRETSREEESYEEKGWSYLEDGASLPGGGERDGRGDERIRSQRSFRADGKEGWR